MHLLTETVHLGASAVSYCREASCARDSMTKSLVACRIVHDTVETCATAVAGCAAVDRGCSSQCSAAAGGRHAGGGGDVAAATAGQGSRNNRQPTNNRCATEHIRGRSTSL